MKRTVALLMAIALMLASCVSAGAASFPDMDSSVWDWARDTVSTLADRGIIKGYSDGTYQPNNSVTNQEAFTLFARIVGVNDADNEYAVLAAQDLYADIASRYNTYATKELCYMLYLGIFTPEELDTYLGEPTKNLELKRHEAAVLITKVMGGEEEVRNTVLYVFDFSDADEIPAASKGYIDFVNKKGIMRGMDDNKFSPNTSVTRAQVAIMLKKTMDTMSLTRETGKISNINRTDKTFSLNGKHIGCDRARVMLAGRSVSFDELADGDDAVVIIDYQGVRMIDASRNLEPEPTYVTGVFTGSFTDTRGTFIKVYDRAAGVSSTKEYQLSPNGISCSYEGSLAPISKLSADDMVKLTLTDGIVTVVEAEPKYTYVTEAYAKEILLNPSPVLKISHSDAAYNGKSYEVYSSAYVSRNGKTSGLRYILPGDNVELKLEYGVIIDVKATSKASSAVGTLKEVTMGENTSSITLDVDGTRKSYAIVRDTEIYIDDEPASIYDLRLGYLVTVSVESDTVTKLAVRSVAQVETLTGTVAVVNVSYGFISLNVTNAGGAEETYQVFVKSGASIIGADGGSRKSLSDLQAGDTILVKGEMNMGSFEATSVVIL